MPQKLIIIGLDGATFDLILPWAEQGKLPNLSRLMHTGISGPLLSTFPPLTGPAWSSFMTGKSPARHGVLEFFRREEGTYRQVLNSRLDIDGKSLWRCLSESDVDVGVMGVPLTYPPEKVKGFMITGLLTPSGRRDFTYPRELLKELENHLGNYRLRHDEKYRRNNPYPFIKEQFEILENNTQAALYLLKNKAWDVFMVHILGTDRIQHEFWHTLDPAHPDHDPAETERLGNIIEDFFKRVDTSIGRLLEAVDPDTAVIVMSDHGFGPVYKFINFNTWLLEQGLLRLKNDPGTRFRHLLFNLGFNYNVLGHWILKLGLGKSAKKMGRAKREDWQRRVFLSLNDVDWSRSKVYSMGNFGQLYVNLKGREPQGIVSPGAEYEDLISDLIERLNAMKDPTTNEPVIERIVRKGEIYTGPYVNRAPDLLFFTRDMQYKAMGLSDFSSNKVFEPVFGTTGHHRMNGVLICCGAGRFKQDAKAEGARIQDLAPTILYLMGQAIPTEMDGKVMLDVFTDEFRDQHSVEYIESDKTGSKEDQSDLTDQERAELESVLRALGYVT
jgi:predicted AlkP superfamily phosphohydrolase/phosphomutase